MCHRFETVSGEEAGAVLDWLRAVRRALGAGGLTAATAVVPPMFGRPVEVPFDALDRYPGAESSVIVMEGDRVESDRVSDSEGGSFAGDRCGDLARVDLLWGVDVSWKRGFVFNARIESALSGPGLWSEAIENGRCVVPVRAFYETRNVESAAAVDAGVSPSSSAPFGDDDPIELTRQLLRHHETAVPFEGDDPIELTRDEVADVGQGILGLGDGSAAIVPVSSRPRGRKLQYRFADVGGAALLLAGLRLGDRFVLVTCEPDAVVGRVHNRMPLSLTAPEALAWLDGSTDARALLARHAPVPLEAREERPPAKRPADTDQLSLF